MDPLVRLSWSLITWLVFGRWFKKMYLYEEKYFSLLLDNKLNLIFYATSFCFIRLSGTNSTIFKCLIALKIAILSYQGIYEE